MNENVGQSVFKLKQETDQKIRELARKTRAPMSEVLEELIAFALEHARLEPVQLYEIRFERSAEDDTAYTLEET